MIQRYPLQWPERWKRTNSFRRIKGCFRSKDSKQPGTITVSQALNRIFVELQSLGVKNVQNDSVISTNLQLRMDGLPRSDQAEPSDPGAAVYWLYKGERKSMAIDLYRRVADNLAAIAATLEAMRTIERHGGAEILDRAFTGFAALPERASETVANWRMTLGFDPNSVVTLAEAEDAFNRRARAAGNDAGTLVSRKEKEAVLSGGSK